MTQWRLRTDAPELLRELEHADDTGRRVVAAAVARMAVDRARLDNPTVERALAVLDEHSAEAMDLLTREAMAALVDRLDETHQNLRAQRRAGRVGQAAVRRGLSQVRAASAVLFALRDSSMEPAAEACYEAMCTVGAARPVQATALDALDAHETAGGPEDMARAFERSQRLSARFIPLHAGLAVAIVLAVALIGTLIGLPVWLKAILIGAALFGLVGDLANYVLCALRLRTLRADTSGGQ